MASESTVTPINVACIFNSPVSGEAAAACRSTIMIGNSLPEYLFIHIAITALRLVAPASITYLVVAGIYGRLLYYKWLATFAAVEASFYLFVYLPRYSRLQVPPRNPPSPLNKAQRKAVVAKLMASLSSACPNDSPYPTGWFLPPKSVPKRGDVVEFILWAFFNGETEENLSDDCKQELDGYIDIIKGLMGGKLEEGRSDGVKSMRLTVDPVVALHRPVVWYLIVALVDTYTSIALYTLGFRHYSSSKWFQTFPPRPILPFLSRRAPSDVLVPYWYRPHRSTSKHPLVFIHGIGIGLYPYLPLLRNLTASSNPDSDVGILLPELLPISMHMTLDPAPHRPLMLATLDRIIESIRCDEENMAPHLLSNAGGWNNVVLAGHSYGSFVSGWIVRDCVDAFENPEFRPVLRTQIAHLVLIDTIPILLSHPSVAYNFLYRDPWAASRLDVPVIADDGPEKNSTEFILIKKPSNARTSAAAWLLWYFASRDADISRTLGRAFFWTEGGLWREDLNLFMNGAGSTNTDKEKRNVTVVLGGCDQIVPSEDIWRHLTGESKPKRTWVGRLGNTQMDLEGGELEILFYPEFGHAKAVESRKSLNAILNVLRRYVNDI